MAKTITLKIQRQDAADRPETRRWEEFSVQWQPQMNVISALHGDPARTRSRRRGKKVAPVVWESVCLEEVCGACTMIINGRVRQACTALVDQIAPHGETITLSR